MLISKPLQTSPSLTSHHSSIWRKSCSDSAQVDRPPYPLELSFFVFLVPVVLVVNLAGFLGGGSERGGVVEGEDDGEEGGLDFHRT